MGEGSERAGEGRAQGVQVGEGGFLAFPGEGTDFFF